MIKTYTNTQGNTVADPTDLRGRHERWLNKIRDRHGNVKYDFYKQVSPKASELITRFVLDLDAGRNLAKGVRKGKRSYAYMVNSTNRLPRLISRMEERLNKELMKFTEDEVLQFFADMRDGIILNLEGQRFISIGNHSKVFCIFWRYIIRLERKNGIDIPDIVYNVDNSNQEKPKWEHFTIKDLERMSDEASSFYYRTLLYFLFDSGIRSPTELMNVRAMDITPIPNSTNLFLYIREDTSKTFGRKIKLMLCSEFLKKFIKYRKLQGEDFLFNKSYTCMNRMISLIGYKATGRGKLRIEPNSKKIVSNGITMYDFRHNSVCHYLPIYKSENQMKYRYGWKNAAMIDYYSEFIGMKDTVSETDMVEQKPVPSEHSSILLIAELLKSQKDEFEKRMQLFEERLEKKG